jgi:hypothetical protein
LPLFAFLAFLDFLASLASLACLAQPDMRFAHLAHAHAALSGWIMMWIE